MYKFAIIGFGNLGRMIAEYVEESNIAERGEIAIYDTNRRIRQQAIAKGYGAIHEPGRIPVEATQVFLCLPTKRQAESYTFEIVTDTLEKIAPHLHSGQAVYITSTAMPGMVLDASRRLIRFGLECNLVYFPQFLREEKAYEDFTNGYPVPNLVFGLHPDLIKSQGSEASKNLQEKLKHILTLTESVFSPLLQGSKKVGYALYTDYETAEHAKILDVLHLMTRISLSNLYYNELRGDSNHNIDLGLIKQIVSSDVRLGGYGFEWGHPFGGRCLPNYLDGLKHRRMLKRLTGFIDHAQDSVRN